MLTFGLFSLFDKDKNLMSASVRFAESAQGEAVIDENEQKGRSSFKPLWAFGPLYEVVCHRFFFVPIHQ